MSRVLITGGAGFLGANLCERLLAEGHEVVCMDDFSTGHDENLTDCLANSRFSLIRHDVTMPFDADVDMVYNLACPASPPRYQADPIRTTKTSFLGALNVLELAERRRIPVLQASTSEVYGDPGVHPQPETYWGNVNPNGIRSCYDEGKRAAESLFFDYHRHRGVDIKVVRIFNTYGPRMDPTDGRVVSNFITQALEGRPLSVFGDGSQTRSFCYVDDLIEGLVRMMATAVGTTGPVNLGNPSEFTVLQLAERVLRLTGSSALIAHRPLPGDDPRQRRPDITRAQALLGWEPRIDLDEGLSRTIEYFKTRIEVPT